VKVTVLSPSGTDYHETITVADDFDLPSIRSADDWLEIEEESGGVWAIPLRFVVSVVLESPPLKKKRRVS
jgi:hypothetical protein